MAVWPGANYVISPSGEKHFLKFGDRRKLASEIKVGCVRHMLLVLCFWDDACSHFGHPVVCTCVGLCSLLPFNGRPS
jgi:hypothetical protein